MDHQPQGSQFTIHSEKDELGEIRERELNDTMRKLYLLPY
jgi:hypothetical protein